MRQRQPDIRYIRKVAFAMVDVTTVHLEYAPHLTPFGTYFRARQRWTKI